jgi:nucleoside-diphosphate-sugar epimerase
MAEVLITGASGFTGTVLLRRLRDENVSTNSAGHGVLQNVDSIRSVLRDCKPQWIFHLAGKLKGTAAQLFDANLRTTIHLLEAAAEVVPSARVLLIGSAAEYGTPVNDSPISEEHPCRPLGPYGISKYAMTLAGLDFAKRTKLQVNIARSFNLIGPGMPSTLLLGAILDRLQKAIETGADTIKVGDISAERDFIDVRDAVEAYLQIMKSDLNGQVVNVCSGIGTSIGDVVQSALKHSPRLICHEYDPKLGSGGAKSVVGNPMKLQSLGFSAHYSLETSIADTCASLRS